ncbi:SH3 domain-containing protein [Streptomyces sp. BE230]|uniref:SH3 domain-containing protein n=1 Tax=Streptomyces sp. BE230 TaxID=3002526 RepID=UPI002ED64699|nr:SH3 domain-containing protein [Streptomyces sp. BE230]
MPWRVATSLETLCKQLDTRFPGRSVAADGGIGDAAHQTRDSDHNPWYGPGIVTARDFTHDPAHGLDIQQVADQLLDSRDPRIKYVIANRRIATNRDWQWAPYEGANPHEAHFHLSVVADPRCDEPQSWNVPLLGETPDGGGGDATVDGDFVTWGTSVNVRAQPRLGAPVVTVLSGPTRVKVHCQTKGDMVDTAGHRNDAWSYVPDLGGYLSNIFIDHPAPWLPGVPDC